MTNFDYYENEHKPEHNSKQPYIPDHPYRILITGGSGSGKAKKKYHFLINKRESTGLKHFSDLNFLIEYSNDMQDVYKNIEECNIGRT